MPNKQLLNQVHKVTDVYSGTHVVYTSGLHGSGYVDYRNLQNHKELLLEVACAIVQKMRAEEWVEKGDTVNFVGPKTLGAMMVNLIKYELYARTGINARVWALDKVEVPEGQPKTFTWSEEKPDVQDGEFVFMDDLLNQGSTTAAVQRLVATIGGRVVGIAVIGDRSNTTPEKLGVDWVTALETFKLEVSTEEDCLLCRHQFPIALSPGHGQKFKEANPTYQGGFVEKAVSA